MAKKRKLPFILRLLAGVVISLILIVGLFLGWQTATGYRPAYAIPVAVSGTPDVLPDTLTLTTYNIGYCGLGAEMDFFYEGGSMTRPTEALYKKYESGLLDRLQQFSDRDFILLQEIDTLSRRSWYSNQLSEIRKRFSGLNAFFAMNYNAWVPLPVTNPMGKVNGGVATLTRHTPVEAVRYGFKTGYSWPMSVFMLKRCYLVTRFKTENGRDLVLVNTHNSAFSDAAEIRKTELAQLRELMESEYAKGNYVLIGGDWNQNPVGFDTLQLLPEYRPHLIMPPIPGDFLPQGWRFAWDPEHCTNRDVDKPYTPGVTKSTLIDFFALSPNIGLLWVKALPTGFTEADHQPATVRVVLEK